MILVNMADGRELFSNLRFATNLISRALGLLTTHKVLSNDAMVLMPCSSIHTWGMKYSIDIMFLDKFYRIKKISEWVHPGKMVICKGAYCVIECKAGMIKTLGLEVGEHVYWRD